MLTWQDPDFPGMEASVTSVKGYLDYSIYWQLWWETASMRVICFNEKTQPKSVGAMAWDPKVNNLNKKKLAEL